MEAAAHPVRMAQNEDDALAERRDDRAV